MMEQITGITKGKLLIYGATGYTGSLIAHEAALRNLDFEIAGRSDAKLSALAAELHVSYHVFSVDDTDGWKKAWKVKQRC